MYSLSTKTSVLPLIATTEIWAILNYFFAVAVYRREFSFTGLLKQMLFLDDSPLSHMWYMPMIIGLYIFVPFLSKIFQQYGQIKYYIIPLLLVAFGSVIIPTLTVFLNEDVLGVHRIALKINTAFWRWSLWALFCSRFFYWTERIIKENKSNVFIIGNGILPLYKYYRAVLYLSASVLYMG